MPTAEVLRDRRAAAEQREAKVEKVIRADELDLAKILAEIGEEREERDAFEKDRRQIGKALDDEIAADKQGKGEKSEEWEARKEAKRDELADLIESSEARLDRLVERVASKDKALDDLRKRDSKLEERIKRLTKKITDKAKPEGQLSAHFHVAEFHCRDGTSVPWTAIPSLKALCAAVLEPQRARFGSVHVNSGFRTADYNARIGGASNSIHIYTEHPAATAADHICASGSARNWFDNTAGKADGRGLYSSFHHADNRNRIGWPDSVWSG